MKLWIAVGIALVVGLVTRNVWIAAVIAVVAWLAIGAVKGIIRDRRRRREELIHRTVADHLRSRWLRDLALGLIVTVVGGVIVFILTGR